MVQPLPHSPPTPWFCVAQDYQGPVSHKTLPDASRSHRVDALPQSDECGQSKGCTTQEAQIGMGSAASVFMHMWTLSTGLTTLPDVSWQAGKHRYESQTGILHEITYHNAAWICHLLFSHLESE